MKILIADDDLTSRTLLRALLTKFDLEPVVTEDGAAAWEQMRSAKAPPLAILDWNMPKLDGLEVCRRIRALASPTPPYLIILTSRAGKEEVVQALDAGANDYISKPYDQAELRARITVGVRIVALQKALADQFHQAQKMEAVGQLASGIAHDFNNILAAILLQIGLLRLQPHQPAGLIEGLAELEQNAKRATNLTRQLLLFSRRQVVHLNSVNLNEILQQMLKMLQRLLGEQVAIELALPDERLWIEADAGMIEQIVLNFGVNARDAMPGGGRLTISAESVEVSAADARANPEARPGPFVRLSVADTGCGMDDATQRRIFEPFFTTKEPGKGTGLGLSTVLGIVRQHRGWLRVTSALGQGSTFSVYLPPCPMPQESAADLSAQKMAPGGKETILLVEDESGVREATSQLLRQKGYRVLEATNGPDALRKWIEAGREVDMLFSDMILPQRMTGLELARQLQNEKSAIKVLLTSGYSPGIALKGSTLPKEFRFLPKPSHSEIVAGIVRECLDEKPQPQPEPAL